MASRDQGRHALEEIGVWSSVHQEEEMAVLIALVIDADMAERPGISFRPAVSLDVVELVACGV